ncbi:hypothetical protein [Sphingomicrobium aestuariivivum]|uniref:hypothetical protein n=1 Tax=Sphingomicrobium aestuariivivum TaxID=1582356 RepID=UPI001FD65B24|nr:hypothetical protein [Sphingomicrobium aestuariivivum]MCJ8191953.1 hypothetical protein [Sphingomicrobium aestuariivivum]
MATDQPKAAKRGNGSINVRARYNQMLLGDWTQLSQADLERIKRVLSQRLEDDEADPLTLEAVLLLCAILSTGRKLSELAKLEIRSVETRRENVLKTPPCLLRLDGSWGWWLPSGAPPRAHVQDKGDMVRAIESVWLPVTPLTREALERSVEFSELNKGRGRCVLFRYSEVQLRQAALSILDDDRPDQGRQRRSARTVEAAERWLFRELVNAPGGDPAVATLLTGREHSVANPMRHYGAKMIDPAVKLHRQAVAPFDSHSGGSPLTLIARYVGDPETPRDDVVGNMIEEMMSALRWRRHDLPFFHQAFTAYTVALLAFALGHRGKFRMPSVRAIDENGFADIIDKKTKGGVELRRTWVCSLARQQLEAYEDHLDTLQSKLPSEQALRLIRIREGAGISLALVKLTKSRKIVETDVNSVITSARQFGWRGSTNAGRHWLRGKMSGKCSSETLGAFFGHVQAGTDPWGPTSALDPLLYRADVSRVVDDVLIKAGWDLQRGWGSPS